MLELVFIFIWGNTFDLCNIKNKIECANVKALHPWRVSLAVVLSMRSCTVRLDEEKSKKKRRPVWFRKNGGFGLGIVAEFAVAGEKAQQH
jgi:hypothetical protein